jgi:hypothetical protein
MKGYINKSRRLGNMPNGGHIYCASCTYSRLNPGKCYICGIEISGFLLCRAFRFPGQSQTTVRKEFKMLKKLKPRFVYAIDNSVVAIGNPEPVFQIVKIGNNRSF